MKLIINKEHTTKAMVAGSNNLIFDSLEADEALSIDGFPSSLIKLSIIVSWAVFGEKFFSHTVKS